MEHLDGVTLNVLLRIAGPQPAARVLRILRTYESTSPGGRSKKYGIELVSPEKDVPINLEEIAQRACERWPLNLVRSQRAGQAS